MGFPIGFNVLRSDAALDAHIATTQPNVMFYMNDWAKAAATKRSYPAMEVIHRVFSLEEDKMHFQDGHTLSHLQARAREVQHDGVLTNLFTEPQIPDDNRLRQLVDECLEALHWATTAGVRVAAPHFAHYGIDGDRWRIVDPLLDYLADHPMHVATYDSYWAAGHAFTGVVDPSLPGGNEIGHIYPETWKRSPIGKHYHCGRLTDNLARRKREGKKNGKTAVTEHGGDALGDVTAWRKTLKLAAGYDDARGWLSVWPQLEAWYLAKYGWTPPRAYAEMCLALWREVYAPFTEILGVCLFCYGTNNDRQWNQFRVDGQPEFFRTLELNRNNVGGVPPVTNPPNTTIVPKPVDAGVPVLARNNAGYNLRTGPGKAYAVVRVLVVGEVLDVYLNETQKTVADGITWVYAQAGTSSGFVALEGQFFPLVPLNWPTEAIDLKMSFVSQRGTGSSNNCPEASLASCLRLSGVRQNKPALASLPVSEVITQMNNAGNTATIEDMIRTAAHWGVTGYKKINQSLTTLRAELQAGLPVIALIDRGKLPVEVQAYYAFGGAHFVPVWGCDDSHILIFDPLQLGTESGIVRVFVNDFLTAWEQAETGYTHTQMMTFDAADFNTSAPPELSSQEIITEIRRLTALLDERIA